VDAIGYLVNGLISPITWIPAFAVAVWLRRQPWYIRILVAACATLVIAVGFALVLTPGDPGNWPTLIGSLLAAAAWSGIGSLVIWGGQRNLGD
jgi:uncharacterized BrkB/YihY/UPF0761 family membrane protein